MLIKYGHVPVATQHKLIEFICRLKFIIFEFKFFCLLFNLDKVKSVCHNRKLKTHWNICYHR